jgi:hypothetical protein
MYSNRIINSAGESKNINLNAEQFKRLNKINDELLSNDKIIAYIDRLKIPPEIKVLLERLTQVIFKINNTIYKVGKKILEVLIFLIKKYPNTLAGTIVGYAIGLLIGNIPIIGWLLGTLAIKIFTALGAIKGFQSDFIPDEARAGIDQYINSMFNSLKNVTMN